MRSALEATFIACLFAFAAGCSSADGGSDAATDHGSSGSGDPAASPAALADPTTTASLQEELRGRRRPRPTNPCAAASCPTNTSCEVVDGQAVCTPLEPAPFCGGFAGIACPGSGTCVDDPSDDCDPERGGADCGGICECNVRALCVRGLAFDASPDVCACVPEEPPVDACASVRCRAGTHCEVIDDRAQCIVDEQVNPCAAVLCPAPSTCEVVGGQGVCTPIETTFCGGIAAFPCPGSGTCVDNPNDGCDPRRGGADCGGICECNIRALCVPGLVFDPSPSVCACVPADGGSSNACSAEAAE
ncbi:MAG TPA: hypothetical protein VFS67_05570 [Polyangiaceae bacterium]|jgi:hypothetical protein|nr:hypothetical protein [Polyangiaceae bacterium]